MRFSPNGTVYNILSGDPNEGGVGGGGGGEGQKGHKDSRKVPDGWPNLLARDSWNTVYIDSNMVSFTTAFKSALIGPTLQVLFVSSYLAQSKTVKQLKK